MILMFFLAKRLPRFLLYFYGRSFLSVSHSKIEELVSISLGEKDKAVIEEKSFQEH